MSNEVLDALWCAYQVGQVSADHTAREVFCEVLAPLVAENQALRNLANNLQPGPISEALAGTRYARESDLVAALKRYGYHDESCKSHNNDKFVGAFPCDCGLDAALSSAKGTQG
jgi:hypothetical protein